jgi:thioredoxin 1
MFMKPKNRVTLRNKMKKVNSKTDLDTQLSKNKSVLAIFYSSWCPYCVRFLPAFNEQIGESRFENVVHVILDDDDNPLWDEYSIAAVPTIIYFEDGKVCNRLDGRLGLGLSGTQLQKWLEEYKKL